MGKALPDDLLVHRPVLTAASWALLEQGELEAAERRLRQVERWLDASSADKNPDAIVADEAQLAVLPASVASARTYLAQAHADSVGALRYARQALTLLPPDDHLRRGVSASLLSLGAWAEGDLAAAETQMADAIHSFQQAGNVLYAITGTYVLADIHIAQGRLHAAFEVCRRALQLAETEGRFVQWGTADIHTGMATIHREWNDLAAAQALARSHSLGEHATLPRWRYRWLLADARAAGAKT
ncbi:MAG: hypothetical protein R2856_29660 [Caldilineaceae bacterium]